MDKKGEAKVTQKTFKSKKDEEKEKEAKKFFVGKPLSEEMFLELSKNTKGFFETLKKWETKK